MQESVNVAPGSVVVVRDEEWLVSSVEMTSDGQLLRVQGLSELVRGTSASFYERLDDIAPLDPADAQLVADDSPRYRRSRLWLEAMRRKTARPMADTTLSVATQALADPLIYQQVAVSRALDPRNLRPRLLLADAVGLGKTLEIGMILSELVRRGRGDRILIVCPRHVLEQMQHEMWVRFALPFVRLDSAGVQRVKQKLPATRNPFTYFKRVIVSMDTLKQARFERDLRNHRWDAVVIDESHNVTNTEAQNNRLARVLSPTTDALILASATPHNGRNASFAELIRLLDPTAVGADGSLDQDRVADLVIRRHRHSPEVAEVVGSEWAERQPPNNVLVPASPEEDAVASELDTIWLHPAGRTPYSGAGSLFGWTLAKAFLSSPAALADSIAERLKRLPDTPEGSREAEALTRLAELNEASREESSKYRALTDLLREIDVRRTGRAVVFSERVSTLHWLREKLLRDFRLKPENIAVLHCGLGDDEQQQIVESFKQETSPIRVLITGDVASEGVNLHRQCHELIHYDIPWSLIRIEQRNGRIDRYGQRYPPRITSLLLDPTAEQFGGDVRVLARLIDKELEAHTALGDAAWLMGKHSVSAEENEIREVLAGQKAFDDVMGDATDAPALDPIEQLLAQLAGAGAEIDIPDIDHDGLYPREVDFLREAVFEVFKTPEADSGRGGIHWREHGQGIVELVPPADLAQRLEVLPQSYLRDRRVMESLKLATNPQRGRLEVTQALSDESDSTWPEAHYLGPLHPVLDWAADQSLASLGRGQVFAVRGNQVDGPTMLLSCTLTNQRGQVVATAVTSVAFPAAETDQLIGLVRVHSNVAAAVEELGFDRDLANPGPVAVELYQHLVPASVRQAVREMEFVFQVAKEAAENRVKTWYQRTKAWQHEADALIQRSDVKTRRGRVAGQAELIAAMRPARTLIRPLLLVLPPTTPAAATLIGAEDAHK
ncbi:helicase [Enemella evansiae]|uniref:helicase-related protein n=1 Tax=Enemella evansiae TaxID=2016499 RepID=UPI000B971CCE|nr:helicase-related protein [Enemella evansiae]OYN99945.1 helicase [Enemella evansiae]